MPLTGMMREREINTYKALYQGFVHVEHKEKHTQAQILVHTLILMCRIRLPQLKVTERHVLRGR